MVESLPLDWPRDLRAIVQAVEHRLEKGIPTTEDTVRYLFFLQLTGRGIETDRIVLERPHPKLTKKEIDLSLSSDGRWWDIECKYNRSIPSGRNLPLAQVRGALIADLFKLGMSDGARGFQIYVAETSIAQSVRRNCSELFASGIGGRTMLSSIWVSTQVPTVASEVNKRLGELPNDMSLSLCLLDAYEGRTISAYVWEVSD